MMALILTLAPDLFVLILKQRWERASCTERASGVLEKYNTLGTGERVPTLNRLESSQSFLFIVSISCWSNVK